MRGRDNPYSRAVAWLKILLPLIALVLLSTLFLLPRRLDPTAALPIRPGGPQPAQQVTRPFYTGTTDDGASITISAASARPGGETGEQAVAEQVALRARLADGSDLTLSAQQGALSGDGEVLRLSGAVRIESSAGYLLQTEAMHAALDRMTAETAGPVSGRGPAGDLRAGRLQILRPAPDADPQLLFTGGVDLVYDPAKKEP